VPSGQKTTCRQYVLIHSLLLRLMLGNQRLGEAIGGICGTLRREGWGESCGYSEASMWFPPPVSVKDRGVGTREQVLNVPITC
jgi:hypothetical protein